MILSKDKFEAVRRNPYSIIYKQFATDKIVYDPVEKKMIEGIRRKKRLLYLYPKLSSGLVPL